MDVAVIGAGAIGLVYCAGLQSTASSRDRVTVVTRREAAVPGLAGGIVVEGPGSRTVEIRPEVIAAGDASGASCAARFDLALVTVKAYDSESVTPVVAALLRPEGVVLSLQNGLDAVGPVRKRLGADRAFQGATTFAASLTGPTSARITATGATWYPKELESLATLAPWLERAGLVPRPSTDTAEVAWQKAAIGTTGYLCVILDQPVGQALRSQRVRELAIAATKEVIAVAQAAGVAIDEDKTLAAQQRVWTSIQPTAVSSMLEDVRAGRPTELEHRLGSILVLAEEHTVNVPVLATIHALARERAEAVKAVLGTTSI